MSSVFTYSSNYAIGFVQSFFVGTLGPNLRAPLNDSGASNLLTKVLELPTGGLAWLQNAVFVLHFAKFRPTGARYFQRGL